MTVVMQRKDGPTDPAVAKAIATFFPEPQAEPEKLTGLQTFKANADSLVMGIRGEMPKDGE